MRESGVRVSEDAPYTLLAQKDRVPDSDSGGRGFDSLRAYHMHEWRNRKTRCAKDAVPLKGMRVRLSPRAPYCRVADR